MPRYLFQPGDALATIFVAEGRKNLSRDDEAVRAGDIMLASEGFAEYANGVYAGKGDKPALVPLDAPPPVAVEARPPVVAPPEPAPQSAPARPAVPAKPAKGKG